MGRLASRGFDVSAMQESMGGAKALMADAVPACSTVADYSEPLSGGASNLVVDTPLADVHQIEMAGPETNWTRRRWLQLIFR